MKKITNRASIFLYVLILINITLVIWYVVFNNTYILNNNINIWKNAEEVFLMLSEKWNINIETVKKYNSNWWWFLDWISCPTNVTMSWSTNISTWLSTTMVNDLGTIYCLWTYNWDEFRIYFDWLTNDFSSAYYKWDLVALTRTTNTDIWVWTTNIALGSSTSSTQHYWNYYASNAKDWSTSTYFDTQNRHKKEWIEFDLWSEKSIWKIIIKKNQWYYSKDRNKWYIQLKDNWWNVVDTITVNNMYYDTYREIDLKYRWLTSDVRSIRLYTNRRYLNTTEFEIYELLSSWWEEMWEWVRTFNDTDDTFISFNSDGIVWTDQIDDDLNSDNYKVTSVWNVYYQDWFQDDDVIPRLIIFWNVSPYTDHFNIYWNNYKTNKIIEENTNNDDILNIKASQVTEWYMFFDIFNRVENLFDIKIMEFDKTAYENEFTLLPINIYNWYNLSDYVWYLQLNWNVLSFSKEKTWNEFKFNFKEKDYWIFVSNLSPWEMSYRLRAETSTWTMIYINPIDDSLTWSIESLSNHIIIWWEKNFIWENFTVVWSK